MSTGDARRTRGPNKGRAWSRATDTDGQVSVIRLELDTSDPVQARRLEQMFSDCFRLRRTLQRQARCRVDAYWADRTNRAADPKASRERYGLTRRQIESAAKTHLDAAPHLAGGCTKAMGLHLADSVWTAVERHLFPDSAGRRAGRPRVGRCFDFARIPGRAESHTKPRKWETFRLHGTLQGHRDADTDPDGRFWQPRRMRPVTAAGSWSQPASVPGNWSSPCGCPPHRTSSRWPPIIWQIRPAGTRSTWSATAIPTAGAAGGTKPT